MKVNNPYKKALKVKQQKELIERFKKFNFIMNEKQRSPQYMSFYVGKEVYDKLPDYMKK